jgi:hypothetical protein
MGNFVAMELALSITFSSESPGDDEPMANAISDKPARIRSAVPTLLESAAEESLYGISWHNVTSDPSPKPDDANPRALRVIEDLLSAGTFESKAAIT